MDPILIFALSFGIMAAFFWYFATENPVKKRWIGTLLTVTLVVIGIFGATPPDEKLKRGIDLAGGSSFVLELKPTPGRQLSATALEQAKTVIRARLNEMGNADLKIFERGSDQLIVQMPGISDDQRDSIREQLEKAAKLDFHLLHPDSRSLAPLVAAGTEYIGGYDLKTLEHYDDKGNLESTEQVLLEREPVLSGKYVTSASGGFVPGQGNMVHLNFDTEGATLFYEVTKANVGKRLAIVLDGEVVSAPNLNEAISGGRCQISGMQTPEEASSLANALTNPLEEAMEVVDERSISPSLGQDAVRQGLFAGMAGLTLTLIFVALYYRLPGFIAIFGLVVNIILLFGIMAAFQFTFTMPGIAGIVLTIGMAVDANVLIYERLKEERAAGKSIGAAIEAAYDKAFSAIFDANITTLITAAILYVMATDAVRGFAVTLMVGIVASLFASLIVTRVLFWWMMTGGLLEKLSIGRKFSIPNHDFLGKRKLAVVVSVAAIIIALGGFVFKGEDSLGIDFRGGDEIQFKVPAEKSITVADIESSIAALKLEQKPIIQAQGDVSGAGTFITIHAADNTALSTFDADGNVSKPGIIDHLRGDIEVLGEKDADGKFLVTQNIQSVGPSMGKSLLTESAVALGVGLLAIMIFISLRYEFSFAVGALAALVHDLIIAGGIAVLLDIEMSVIQVGAFLTIAGYSINDTIVVFDRIRENLQLKSGNVIDIVNSALNATLSRTILTSGTTLVTLATLSIFGGPGMRDFSLTILIGVVVGTYSSVFVASPVTLWWAKLTSKNLRKQVLDTEAAKEAAMTAQAEHE